MTLFHEATALVTTLTGVSVTSALGLFIIAQFFHGAPRTALSIAAIAIGFPAILLWFTTSREVIESLPGAWESAMPPTTVESIGQLWTQIVAPILTVIITPVAGVVVAVSAARAQFHAAMMAAVATAVVWGLGWFGIVH